MKTIKKFRALFVAGLFLCIALPQAKAQLPATYVIVNSTACDVMVDYQLYDSNCLPIGNPVINQLVTSSGYSFNPGSAYEIGITVTSMYGCAVTQNPFPAGGCNSSAAATLNVAPSCGCTLNTINVTSAGATIN